ncbi:SRPBCC family protein [Mycobacterium sp. NBC_00419]|uniref:SRPBCC family protein n=1 Tax=Mycobacterium sp. NBC_00419 TaxID=2975989 RepID=UPI002E20B262
MAQPVVEVSTEIAAPIERVWELVSDITLMPPLSTELQSVRWADSFDAPCLGAQFLGTNRHEAVGVWTTRSHITVFEPPRTFEWTVGDPEGPAAIWRFDLSPATNGTRLRYSSRLGTGKSGVTMMIEREPQRAAEIVDTRMEQFRQSMTVVVAGVKALAETEP